MSSREYRADIDGLRALAVSAVVFYHALPELLPAGFVGVDIFFVISGYLIGGIIYSGIIDSRFTFADFYGRRVKRILPALIVVVTFTVLAGLVLLDSEQFKILSRQSIAALVGASNFYFWEHTDYFAAASELQPLLMTWSLGVEEQFYVVFPFLIIAIAKVPKKYRVSIMAAISISSFAFMLWLSSRDPVSTFYLLPSRAWELGIGATLAMMKVNGDKIPVKLPSANFMAIIGAILIACAVLAFDNKADFPIAPVALSVLGTAILIQTQASWINRRALSLQPVVFVGLISYSWYLWHWPIMAYIRIVADESPSQIALLIAIPLSFLIAILSWRFVEQPFRKPSVSSARALWTGGGVLAAAMMMPLAGHLTKGLPDRLPEAVRSAEGIRLQGRGICMRAYQHGTPDTSERCAPQNARIALIGDSHASALGAGLASLADDHGTKLAQHTKASCLPLLGYSHSTMPVPENLRTCGAFVSAATELVLQDPAIEVIVIAAFWPKDDSETTRVLDGDSLGASMPVGEVFAAGIEAIITKADMAGKRVVLVEDTPIFEVDTMSRTIGDALPVRKALRDWVSEYSATGEDGQFRFAADTAVTHSEEVLIRLAEKHENARFFRMRSQFCEGSNCLYMQSGKPLFYDRHHLSAFGSKYVDWSAAFEGTSLAGSGAASNVKSSGD